MNTTGSNGIGGAGSDVERARRRREQHAGATSGRRRSAGPSASGSRSPVVAGERARRELAARFRFGSVAVLAQHRSARPGWRPDPPAASGIDAAHRDADAADHPPVLEDRHAAGQRRDAGRCSRSACSAPSVFWQRSGSVAVELAQQRGHVELRRGRLAGIEDRRLRVVRVEAGSRGWCSRCRTGRRRRCCARRAGSRMSLMKRTERDVSERLIGAEERRRCAPAAPRAPPPRSRTTRCASGAPHCCGSSVQAAALRCSGRSGSSSRRRGCTPADRSPRPRSARRSRAPRLHDRVHLVGLQSLGAVSAGVRRLRRRAARRRRRTRPRPTTSDRHGRRRGAPRRSMSLVGNMIAAWIPSSPATRSAGDRQLDRALDLGDAGQPVLLGIGLEKALFSIVFISGDPGSGGMKLSAPSTISTAHRPHRPTLHSQPSGSSMCSRRLTVLLGTLQPGKRALRLSKYACRTSSVSRAEGDREFGMVDRRPRCPRPPPRAAAARRGCGAAAAAAAGAGAAAGAAPRRPPVPRPRLPARVRRRPARRDRRGGACAIGASTTTSLGGELRDRRERLEAEALARDPELVAVGERVRRRQLDVRAVLAAEIEHARACRPSSAESARGGATGSGRDASSVTSDARPTKRPFSAERVASPGRRRRGCSARAPSRPSFLSTIKICAPSHTSRSRPAAGPRRPARAATRPSPCRCPRAT